MRSNEIFSRMTTEEAIAFLDMMKRDARPVAGMALSAAAQAFKLRPEFLRKQSKARQAEWTRKALGRSVAAPLSEELLATYFLDYQQALLVELLDALGVKHEEGQLESADPECPPADKLREVVNGFLEGEGRDRRELLLWAFAAQAGIDWPPLEQVLGEMLPQKSATSPEAERETEQVEEPVAS